jgi:hypothetical protein
MVARLLGVLFLLGGVAGFIPWLAPNAPFDAPYVTLDQFYRLIGGLFAVNLAHDIVHVFFGLWGLLAGYGFKTSRFYCRAVFWIYLLLIVLGAIPITSTLFGVAPIYGWDIALHAIMVLLAAYGGYGAASREPAAEEVLGR